MSNSYSQLVGPIKDRQLKRFFTLLCIPVHGNSSSLQYHTMINPRLI